MDDTDRKILAELQRDARLTITELAERVRLSLSPAHRRLRELERSGVISSYRAHLNPAAVGLPFEAFVFFSRRLRSRGERDPRPRDGPAARAPSAARERDLAHSLSTV